VRTNTINTSPLLPSLLLLLFFIVPCTIGLPARTPKHKQLRRMNSTAVQRSAPSVPSNLPSICRSLQKMQNNKPGRFLEAMVLCLAEHGTKRYSNLPLSVFFYLTASASFSYNCTFLDHVQYLFSYSCIFCLRALSTFSLPN
jgi:hypothetical protein